MVGCLGPIKTTCLKIEAKAVYGVILIAVPNDHAYRLENLAPGAYQLAFAINGRTYAETRFLISAEERPPPLAFAITARTEPITQAGTKPHPILVNFAPMSDRLAQIDINSLDDSDLLLKNTRDSQVLKAPFNSVIADEKAKPNAAGMATGNISKLRYLVNGPECGWSVASDGEYVVELVDAAITYNDGLRVPGRTISSLAVKMDRTEPPAFEDYPIVVVGARNVLLGGATTETADVMSGYPVRLLAIDPSGVKVASVQAAPLTITRRNGTLSKESLQEARNDPASVSAYTIFPTSVTALDAEATVVLAAYEIIPHLGIWTAVTTDSMSSIFRPRPSRTSKEIHIPAGR